MIWGFVLRIVGPLVAIAAIFGMGYSMGGASKQRAWDLANARQVQAQLKASEEARATEARLQGQLQEAQREREKERQKHARIAGDLRRELDGLRGDLATYAAGSDNDTLASCHGRATALGDVLGEALQTSLDCANEAESLATDVRALRSAWPVERE